MGIQCDICIKNAATYQNVVRTAVQRGEIRTDATVGYVLQVVETRGDLYSIAVH